MRKLDYTFLRDGMIPANIVNMIAGAFSLKMLYAERKVNYVEVFSSLEAYAKIQSVKSSNAIEGIVTSIERITALMNGTTLPLNHSEEEIAGYRDALNLIHTSHSTMDFTESDIISLQNILMSFTDRLDKGKYKENDNLIIEYDTAGNRRVRFRPLSARETPFAMRQLELAYIEARDSGVNGLLLIPCVILDFLCIHPFSDENGRLSRLLSLLLLYKNGFDVGKYISFESKIEEYKEDYYESLRQSSVDWENGKNDYFPFIENFLLTLLRCYKDLDSRFKIVGEKKFSKKNRVEDAILSSTRPISKAEICLLLSDVSPTTVEAVLGEMVREGKVRKIGSGRSTRYYRP